MTAGSLVVVTTAVSSRAALCFMAKWTRWKTPGGSRPACTGKRCSTPRCRRVRCAAARFLLYEIPRVIIGENQTFLGDEEHLRANGVELEIVQSPECIELMRRFIADSPELWNEDIGVE